MSTKKFEWGKKLLEIKKYAVFPILLEKKTKKFRESLEKKLIYLKLVLYTIYHSLLAFRNVLNIFQVWLPYTQIDSIFYPKPLIICISNYFFLVYLLKYSFYTNKNKNILLLLNLC